MEIYRIVTYTDGRHISEGYETVPDDTALGIESHGPMVHFLAPREVVTECMETRQNPYCAVIRWAEEYSFGEEE